MSALDELIQMDEEWEKDWPMEDFEIVITEAKQDLAQLRKENEQLKEGIKEAKSLLVESKEYVEDMVGIASGARGLPEIITSWLERWGEWIT